MNPEFKIRRFAELSPLELHDAFKLRSDVFLIEQDCLYPDVDGKDPKAVHVLGYADGVLVAYCRCFDAGYYFDNASIGRVVIHPEYRDRKWGYVLMEAGISAVEDHFRKQPITISAQAHLERFYGRLGFVTSGDSYMEDGIPHLRMHRA